MKTSTQPSPSVSRLLAAARSAGADRSALFQQAARSWQRMLTTGKASSNRAVPEVARLHAAAEEAAGGDHSARSFSFIHEGHRYRVHVHPRGGVDVFSFSRLPLTLGYRKGPSK